MYGYIYLTTNLINGKRYIGQKKATKFLGNNYLGSGVYLGIAVRKYGRENFKTELIEWCETFEIINERERYWISYYNAVDSSDFYNEAYGGQDVSPMRGKKRTVESRNKQSNSIKSVNNPFYGKHHSEESIQKIKNNMPDLSGSNNPMYGKKTIGFTGQCHSEESKIKMSNSAKGRIHGIWITNDIEEKQVFSEDLNKYLDIGYRIGRKYRKRNRKVN